MTFEQAYKKIILAGFDLERNIAYNYMWELEGKTMYEEDVIKFAEVLDADELVRNVTEVVKEMIEDPNKGIESLMKLPSLHREVAFRKYSERQGMKAERHMRLLAEKAEKELKNA